MKPKTKLSLKISLMIFLTVIIISNTILAIILSNHKLDRTEMVATALPIMSISLNDEYKLSDVNREEYVTSKITITNTDENYCINELDANFKGRGNGSWNASKKGYKIKLDKKTSLFGKTKNKHWVLNACANFDDVTMYRNYLAYNMASSIFNNIEYTTTADWIDLYVNGIYQGVYVFCDHVRVDSGRVNIQSDYGVLDTGYLIEYDAYATGTEGVDYFRINGVRYPFTLHSPDPEDYSKENLTQEQYMEQVNYIKNYVQNAYSAALQNDFESFESFVDINSFVDMYILHEYFKNTDAGWSSFYLYKKPNGKLFAGPAWDFDGTTVAARGDSSPEGIYVGDKVQEKSPETANELLIALYNNEDFKNLVRTRWNQLSTQIKNFIDEKMNDEIYEDISYAMARNTALWKNVSVDNGEKIWLKEVNNLKNWLDARILFLNNEWNIL